MFQHRICLCAVMAAVTARLFLGLALVNQALATTNLPGPYIYREPEDLLIADAIGKVTLTCDTKGHPPPVHEWYTKFEEPQNETVWSLVEASEIYAPNADGSLMIDFGVLRSSSGIASRLYQCRATNSYGTVMSRIARVSFAYLYSLESEPLKIVEGKEHTTLSLKCPLEHAYPTASFAWYKDNKPAEIMRPEFQRDICISKDGSLHFSHLSGHHQATYHCIAALISEGSDYKVIGNLRNKVTVHSQGISLTVIPAPAPGVPSLQDPAILPEFILVYPERPTRGANVTLQCYSYDFLEKPFEYSWIRYSPGGTRLFGLGPGAVLSDRKRTLFLPDVSQDFAATYTCDVIGDNGGRALELKELKIDTRPIITEEKEEYLVNDGDEVVLDCFPYGFPKPVINWYKDGVWLNLTDPQVLPSLTADSSNHVLTIAKFQPSEHSGMYQCEASNSRGTSYHTVQILSKGAYSGGESAWRCGRDATSAASVVLALAVMLLMHFR